jgi:glycosyltransferase involved in cell wall biosynthesis
VILIDVTHTAHTEARTGVQRVCRRLCQTFPTPPGGSPITWDPYLGEWRTLGDDERARLAREQPGPRRSASWSWRQRVRGWSGRVLGRTGRGLPAATGLIVPEIFSPETAAAWPALFTRVQGPRIALFHDAIALKRPELAPAKTVARFPSYLRDLLAFDGVAAVSEDSREVLRDWWRWLGVSRTPELVAISLGVDAPRPDPALARATSTPVVLTVGTLEARKNHLSLFDACESLWTRGISFELRVIGLVPQPKSNPALARLRQLQTNGRSLRYDGAVDDATLSAAYHECSFSVYPSLMEGFGLPVLESVSYGKPCVCSARGALGESARKGGCLALADVEAPTLARAIETLLIGAPRREALASEARSRALRSWNDYTSRLAEWMRGLNVRRTS